MHRTYTKRAEEIQKKEINRKKKKIFLTSVLQIPNRMLKIKVGKGRKEQEGETRIKCIVRRAKSFVFLGTGADRSSNIRETRGRTSNGNDFRGGIKTSRLSIGII